MVKLNGVRQTSSIEYKMMHGLIQAVFTTYNFENSAILDLSSFQLYLLKYPSGHFQLSSPWHVCSSTCFSRTNCSLSRFHAKGELNRFNCKAGFFRLFTPMFTKERNYNPRFGGKNQLLYGEYLTIIKKKLSDPRVKTAALIEFKPGLHMVGRIVSTCLRPCPKEHITAL